MAYNVLGGKEAFKVWTSVFSAVVICPVQGVKENLNTVLFQIVRKDIHDFIFGN